MPFDISPQRVQPESFEHDQNISVSHKNVPEYLESHRTQSEFLKCSSIVKEYTTNFYSSGNWAQSGTSVMGV